MCISYKNAGVRVTEYDQAEGWQMIWHNNSINDAEMRPGSRWNRDFWAPEGAFSAENDRKSRQIVRNFLLTYNKEESRIAKRCGVTKSRQMLTNLQVFTVCLQTMTKNIAENCKN